MDGCSWLQLSVRGWRWLATLLSPLLSAQQGFASRWQAEPDRRAARGPRTGNGAAALTQFAALASDEATVLQAITALASALCLTWADVTDLMARPAPIPRISLADPLATI